jgi:hypothetical protein
MVDAFPSFSDDPDHQFQLLIDADLENARRVLEAFDKEFPLDPAAKAMVMFERMRMSPRPEALYPHLFAAYLRDRWVAPMVRRFSWNQARAGAGEPWLAPLAAMIQISLEGVRSLSEPEFLALAEAAAGVTHLHGGGCLHAMSLSVRQLERAAPLSRRMVDALRELMTVRNARDQFVWPFFRSESAFDDSYSWCARVRGDLAAMEANCRAAFLRTFDGDPYSAIMPAKGEIAAAKCLDPAQLEAGIGRWIRMLRDSPGAVRSWVEMVVLTRVIRLCGNLGGDARDQLLYEIACAPWTRQTDLGWINIYLSALTQCSEDRAFACLEALMMNPATATDAVRIKYDALLVVFGAGALPASALGVDGFPLDHEPGLRPQQVRMNQLLRVAKDAAARGPYTHPGAVAPRPHAWFPVAPEVTAALQTMETAILREFSSEPASLHRAAVARADWIDAHQHEYSPDTLQVWTRLLRGLGCEPGLLERSLAPVNELPLDSLLDAIRTGGGNLKIFELCQRYVADHGWHADLVEAFRRWIRTLGTGAGDQTRRAQMEWFVWFETAAPIQLDACWSHHVKRDLRAMSPKERAAWQALLANTTYIVTGKPPKTWLKQAAVAFHKLGAAAFRRRFLSWFEPFGNPEPLRLTVAGRNLLRILMWYALIAKDAAVDEALLGFAKAKWKTKEAGRCAAQAQMAFSYILSQRAPQAALPILEGLVTNGQAFEGSATHRVYRELCARARREPAPAIPRKEKSAKEHSPNPLLDGLTVGDVQRLMKPRTP